MKRRVLLIVLLTTIPLRLGAARQNKLTLTPVYNDELQEEILQGTFLVNENPRVRRGLRIKIHFIKLPARNRNPLPDPILHFCGGPGIGGTEGVARWARLFEKLRLDRDILLIDQRGTGQSNPLPCTPLGDPDRAQTYLNEMYPRDYVQACRKELEKRANLEYYHTSIAVDDYDALRQALGYDLVNVVGGSYGSRSGYVYMKRYPERVRSAFLWSISLLGMQYPATLAEDTQEAMDRLFQACAEDPTGSADYPDLRRKFQEVLDRLHESAVTVRITNPLTGTPETVTYGYHNFITEIRSLLYSASGAKWIPLFIHWAHQGYFAPIVEDTVAYLKDTNTSIKDGLFLSVICPEDTVHINYAEAEARAAGTFMGTYRLEQQKRACELWPRSQIPPDYFDLPPLQIPTLLVSGELDPVNTAHFGNILAATLPNCLHKVIPNLAHGINPVWPSCLDDIVWQFINQASWQGLDFSCAMENKRPAFVSWKDYSPSRDVEPGKKPDEYDKKRIPDEM